MVKVVVTTREGTPHFFAAEWGKAIVESTDGVNWAPLGAGFRHLRLDSVAATFLGGTTEIQRNVIATRGLGLPRERK